MRHLIEVLTSPRSVIHKTRVCMITLTILAMSFGALGRTQEVTPPDSQQDRSRHIHEILQEARSYQAADAKTRAALHEIVSRQTTTFSEFKKQCADLKAILAESDAMEKRKRQMLTELQLEFRDDSKVQPIFSLLHQMEGASDKVEPIWRGMIACSGVLASSALNKQEAYQAICVDPVRQQLSLLAPELNRLGRQLQAELLKDGTSLPPELLHAIGQ